MFQLNKSSETWQKHGIKYRKMCSETIGVTKVLNLQNMKTKMKYDRNKCSKTTLITKAMNVQNMIKTRQKHVC